MLVMTSKIKIKAIALILTAVFILTACGQKRPLYLPEEPATNTRSSNSETSPTDADQGKP